MDTIDIRFLQDTVNSLSCEQVRCINDKLAQYQESLMTGKDRKALLQYWISVAQRNDSFRDWLSSQLAIIDPKAMMGFHTAVGVVQHVQESDDRSKSDYSNSYMIAKYLIAVILFLSVAIVLIIVATIAFSPDSIVTTSKNVPTRIVVAENDTVLIGTYSSSTVPLSVNEVVLNKGDAFHKVYLLVVPEKTLKYYWTNLNHKYNGTTIVDRLPVVNYMYVYLLADSIFSMEVCMGNVSNSPPAMLYGFDNETQYIQYNEYLSATNPALKVPLNVGGPGVSTCTNTTLTAKSSNYYFFILLAPLTGTVYSVKTNIREKYLKYQDYFYNYSYCVVANGHNCSLSLTVNSEVIVNKVAVLAYTVPNYSFTSKINHLDIGMEKELDTNHTILIFWCLIGLSFFLLFSVILVVLYFLCTFWLRGRKRRVRKYSRIPVNGIN